jgi:hypothetical protein
VAASINDALDQVPAHHYAGQPGFVLADLEAALRVASSYQLTLEEILPASGSIPSACMSRSAGGLGYQRDTVLAGHPAFAADDTLITDERSAPLPPGLLGGEWVRVSTPSTRGRRRISRPSSAWSTRSPSRKRPVHRAETVTV